MLPRQPRIPLWLKVPVTVFVRAHVSYYWRTYGAPN
jgi:hypothetical protein